MVQINMREMLEAGVHFGHQVRRWNPKMKPYIFGKKNGIYIIDLQTSIELFKKALNFISTTVASGKDVLIVGTKKQAQTIVKDVAEESGMHYVNKRWLGGLLTNFPMIKKSLEKLLELEEMKRDGRWEVKSKKEQSRLEKIYKKLYKNLWGIRNMTALPGALLVIDSNFEEIAIDEARRLEVPIVAVVDTNSNPEIIDYPVPGNDDAIRSIRLFISKFGDAVKEGKDKFQVNTGNSPQVSDEEHSAKGAKPGVENGELVTKEITEEEISDDR